MYAITRLKHSPQFAFFKILQIVRINNVSSIVRVLCLVMSEVTLPWSFTKYSTLPTVVDTIQVHMLTVTLSTTLREPMHTHDIEKFRLGSDPKDSCCNRAGYPRCRTVSSGVTRYGDSQEPWPNRIARPERSDL